jgi:hypothetical protein
VAGFALWWWSDGKRPLWAALPGTALALALYANVILATALVVLFAVELVAALRRGRAEVVNLGKRIAVAAASAVGVLLVGYVSYLKFSSASPDDLLRPTIDFLLSNEENSSLYQRPLSDVLNHEVRIWAPVVLSVALVAVLGRRILLTSLPARIAQVCVGYTAFLWLYRLTITSSVLETWWAYDLVVVVTAPAVGVLLQELRVAWRSDRSTAIVAVAATGLVALVLRTFSGLAEDVYRPIADHPGLLFAVVAVSVCLAALLAVVRRWAQVAALVGLLASLTLVSWAPSVFDGRGTTGVFVTDGDLDWDTYAAGRKFVELFRDYDTGNTRVYTWYPDPMGPDNIGWTTLPHLGRTVHAIGTPATLKTLEPLGRARLLQPDAAYVLAMSTHPGDLPAAERALRAAGFRGRNVRRGDLADGRLHYVLIAITRKPAA